MRQVVACYNISCYRIDSLMEAHRAPDGRSASVPTIRVVGSYEEAVNNLAHVLNSEFELTAIKEAEALSGSYPSNAHTYLAGLKQNRLQLPEYRMFAGQQVEIKVSSILQDVHAAMEKDIAGGAGAVPEHLKRDLYRVGALLETADIEFQKIKNKVNGDAAPAQPAMPVIAEVVREVPAAQPAPQAIPDALEAIKAIEVQEETGIDGFAALAMSINNFDNNSNNDTTDNSYLDLVAPEVVTRVTENPLQPAITPVPETIALNIDNVETFKRNGNGVVERTTDVVRESNTLTGATADRSPAPEEIAQMTESMLREFVSGNRLVKEIDRMIAERAGARINDEIDIEGDVERLRFLKVFTLKQLQERLTEHREDVVAFAEKWIGKDNGGSFDSGICLFYLEYLLVGKKNDPAFAVEYVLKFISDNDYSARYIIPTYNAIRQTAEPSNFAHLTIK